jgi:hypothetical protein
MDYITEFAKNKPTTPTSEVHNAIYEARGTAPELLIIIILLVHVFLQSYYIYFTLVQLVSFFCLSFTFGVPLHRCPQRAHKSHNRFFWWSPLSSASAFSIVDQSDMWCPRFTNNNSSFDVRLDNPFHVEGLKEFSGPYSTIYGWNIMDLL